MPTGPRKPQIPTQEVDPKEAAKLEASVLRRDQAPTLQDQTPDKTAWTTQRDELGPPFDSERVTLRQMRQLRKDPMIAFGLHYIKVPLAKAEWHIEARDKNGPNAQVAAFVDACLRIIYSRYIFQRTLALDFGFQAIAKRWQLANPSAVYADPTDLDSETGAPAQKPVWDEGSVLPKIWNDPVALRPELVEPKFVEGSGPLSGQFDGILLEIPATQRRRSTGFKTSQKNQGQQEIDIYHALWATNMKDDEHGSMYGYPRTGFARDYWWTYRYLFGMSNRSYERMAIPPVLAFHPEGSTVIDELGNTRPNWEIALEMAERLRNNAVAAVPSTMAEGAPGEASNTQRAWDFKFMDTPTEALSVYDARFNYLNVMKLRAVWVPDMAFMGTETGNSGGNIAEQMSTILNESQVLLMDEIINEINKYMIPQLLMLNFPEFINNGGVCRMISHGFRKQDLELYKQILQLAGQANAQIMDKVDLDEIFKRADIPLLSPEAYAFKRQAIVNQPVAGPPAVSGVTIANPNFNTGVTNGGSQPEPANQNGNMAGIGFAEFSPQQYIYVQPNEIVGYGDFAEFADSDDFLANLPSTRSYEDKSIRALALQLRRLWAGYFKRLYPEFAKHVSKHGVFEFADDGKTYRFDGDNLFELADDPKNTGKKVVAGAAVTYISERKAKAAANKIINDFAIQSKVLKEMVQKSAEILRKMMTRAHKLEQKNSRLTGDLDVQAFDTFLEEQSGRLIKVTHQTFKDELREFLVNELRENKGSREIADNIVAHFTNFPVTKADRIARSETRDATNAAALIASESHGVKYVKQHDGEQFDPDCAARNNTLATVKEAWKNLRREHPNGTLWFEPIPRANLAIEWTEDMEEEQFAYFDDDSSTVYIRSGTEDYMVKEYLSAIADTLITNNGKALVKGS